MSNVVYKTYNLELEKIKRDEDVIAIFLVGSSKNIDLKLEGTNINDIDIFVIKSQKEYQIRNIKKVNGIEFDINYFSIDGYENFLEKKEYFFLNEMENAKVLYDKNNIAHEMISTCKEKYKEGPNKKSKEEKESIKEEIISKIEKLKDKNKFINVEYEFLTNLYLKDIIVGYFMLNDKWVPKDKKLIGNLKNQDVHLISLIERFYNINTYENLLNICDYVLETSRKLI